MGQDKKGTILVIGDDLASLGALFEHLDQAGFQVLVAQDGVERSQPDVILLDVKMSDMDGFEVRRRLKERGQTADIPVIFLTVVDDVASVLKGLDLAAVDYVTKPFEPEEVVARVEKHLTLHSLQRQLEAQDAQLQQEIAQRKRVEEELLKHQEHVEELVEERTAELTASNEQLRQEIAARLQAEAELKVKDSALASSINGIGLTDLEGTLIYANDSLVRMWGYESADEMLGRSLPEFWEGEGILETVKALREKGGRQGEDIGKRKDGSLFPVQFAASMIKDETGKPVYMFGSFFDITERKKAEEELQKYHQHLEELVEERTVELKEANENLQQEIAERVQAEEALRESEEMARALLNAPTDSAMLIELDGTIVGLNETMANALGQSPNELIGQNALDFLPSDLAKARETRSDEVVHSGRPVRFQDTRGGRWFDNQIYPVFDAGGKVSRLAIYARDITESKQAEAALRGSEEKYRNLVEKIKDVIYAIDTEGVITYVSPAIESSLGYSPPEVVGRRFAQFIAPEDLPRVRDGLQQLSSGESPGPNEYRVVTKSGEVRWMRTSSQPVVEGNRVTGMRGMLTDITRRKQMEEALRASEQLLQSALDALSANIAILDDSGTIIAVNASWRTFGDENGLAWADYGVGRNYLAVADSASGDSAAGAQEAAQGIRELLSGQRDRFSVKYPCHGPSQERWFIMHATRFESSNGVRVAVSHENITERVRAERQLEEEAATAERERLARELHDAVTQVLFSASLIADTLPRVWERHPEKGRQGLEELRRLTQGALAEMRALLLELRPGALSEQELGVLLRQLTGGMMARTRMPVATTVVSDRPLPTEVQIALYRIAQEALNNIAKHAQASRATVSLDNEPDRVTLRISDDGRGFDPSSVQAHQLGMKIMHERAQAIGAAIRATSQPGQGTELIVVWPGDGETKDGH